MLTSQQNSAYIIAEVGQNHQGDFDLAKRYIEEFAKLGADAIKFQKRDLKTLFEAERLDRPYESDNAFGTTYGEHRETLEFSVSQMQALKMHCDEHDVDFMCTAFDHASLDALADIECSKIKLASFDMGNIALITAALETSADVILSSGEVTGTLLRRPAPISKIDLGPLPCCIVFQNTPARRKNCVWNYWSITSSASPGCKLDCRIISAGRFRGLLAR